MKRHYDLRNVEARSREMPSAQTARVGAGTFLT